jgi:UDP-glucose 4-epimerase
MKVLITGAVGFLGSHLCDKYVSDGHTVVALDNFSNGNLTNVRHLISNPKFKLIKGDIRDKSLLNTLMPGVDVVFHLAAQIHVDRSLVEPEETWTTNVLGTLNVLESARMHDVEKIIPASSSEVYGPAQYVPIDENHPLDAVHPYGASKIAADRMCFAYVKSYGLNVCVTRCFNLYGPNQKDTGYGGVISIFTKRVLSGQPPIIYGDGSQSRDYLSVFDAVRAYDHMFKWGRSDFGPVNFGTGIDITINDLAVKIMSFAHADLSPVHVSARPGEVSRLIADFSKAQKYLHWKPEVSIDVGLKNYVEWYKNCRGEELMLR